MTRSVSSSKIKQTNIDPPIFNSVLIPLLDRKQKVLPERSNSASVHLSDNTITTDRVRRRTVAKTITVREFSTDPPIPLLSTRISFSAKEGISSARERFGVRTMCDRWKIKNTLQQFHAIR